MKQFKQSQLQTASDATDSVQFCLNTNLNYVQHPIEMVKFYCGRNSGY